MSPSMLAYPAIRKYVFYTILVHARLPAVVTTKSEANDRIAFQLICPLLQNFWMFSCIAGPTYIFDMQRAPNPQPN